MEAVAAPDACANPRSFMEESPAMAARRRRMEIGRFKIMASCGNFADAMKKRSRTQGGAFCNSCFGEEEPSIDGDSDGGMDFENAPLPSQGLYPPGRLVRSVSTPAAWNGGLFCTCSAEKYWAKDGSPKENTLPGEDDAPSSRGDGGSGGNDSGKNAALNETHSGSDGAEPMESEPRQGSAQQQNPTEGKPDAQQTTQSDGGEGPLPLPPVEAEQRRSDEKKPLLNRNSKGICRANSESVGLLLKDPCPPHGTMSIIGRRREMEDAVSVIPSFFTMPKSSSCSGMQQGHNGFGAPTPSVPLHFFAVYDGHGGPQASIFCKDHFHEALAQELRNSCAFSKDFTDWTKVMSACFTKMDIEVGGLCPNGSCGNGELDVNDDCCQDPIAPENVGSTAVIAVVSPSQVVIANCGDSRAVLCRGGRAIPLSNDHKPEREDEMTRIEAAGGRVICWNGYRVGGFLAMSRAIG